MSCLLCGNEKLKKVFAPALANGGILCRCRSCGLLQMSPMPTDEEIVAYYQKYDVLGVHDPYYREAWQSEIGDTPEAREAKNRLRFIGPCLFTGAHLLDVGSGSGLFMRLANEAGLASEGVELNSEAAVQSAKHFNLKVKAGSIDAAEGEYDALSLWDILEHVNDPIGFIKKCATHVKTNGWLFIETPNEAALLDRIVNFFRRVGIKSLANTFYGMHHLVLFRPATLNKLLEENGFVIEKISFVSTDPARVFRGGSFRDKMMRLGLGIIAFFAVLFGRQNKMLIAARKLANS
jgi:2-polyprenyl-3-methyl-5-hydroxy-6-metoxy-1,4-benzoquinol methylase